MNLTIEQIAAMPAGRELDALIAERVRCLSLTPPREYAMARVAAGKVLYTGPVFRLYNGRDIAMPAGDTLRPPTGSSDYNDRYYLYIAERLGDEITAEVNAYRLEPPPYSTDIAAAKLATDAMITRGWTCNVYGSLTEDDQPCWTVSMEYLLPREMIDYVEMYVADHVLARADTEELARARAALIAWAKLEEAQ